MEKENIKKIAKEKLHDKSNVAQYLFVEFLSGRFPNESDNITSYFSEWADRFNTGTPENYMDAQSQEVYNSILDDFEEAHQEAMRRD